MIASPEMKAKKDFFLKKKEDEEKDSESRIPAQM
jgi:hypothetical protein